MIPADVALFLALTVSVGCLLAGVILDRHFSKKKAKPTTPAPSSILTWCDGCDRDDVPISEMDFTEVGQYRCAKCRGVSSELPTEPESPEIPGEKSRCWDCDRKMSGPPGRCATCAKEYGRRRRSERVEAGKPKKKSNEWETVADAADIVLKAAQREIKQLRQEQMDFKEKLYRAESGRKSYNTSYESTSIREVHEYVGRNIELDSVPSHARVTAQGGGASITVHGTVGANAQLVAQGGSAKITIGGHIGAGTRVVAQGGGAQIKYSTAHPTARIIAQGGDSKVTATGRKSA